MDLVQKKNIITDEIINKLRTVFDPEIPVDIYELGLVYEIKIEDNLDVTILMTLTSPNCPVAESLPIEVEEKVRLVKDVKEVNIELTFEPPWSQDMMSDEAKLDLGFL